MSTGNKVLQLVEEIPSSPKNKTTNIIIELPQKKADDVNKSENSAEFS